MYTVEFLQISLSVYREPHHYLVFGGHKTSATMTDPPDELFYQAAAKSLMRNSEKEITTL